MEREFLTRAFAVVKDLELRRIAAIRSVVAAFAEAYKYALSPHTAASASILSPESPRHTQFSVLAHWRFTSDDARP